MFAILYKACRNWLNRAAAFARNVDQSYRDTIRMIKQDPKEFRSQIMKRFLQGTNHIAILARKEWPRRRVSITVGLFGLVLGYTFHRWGDIRQMFSKPPEYHLEESQKELITKLAPVLSDFINKSILKSDQVQDELAKLIYSICISNNIVHITAYNLNKVVRMEEVSNFSVELTKQQLTQNLFKNIAYYKFREVLINILRMDNVRNFIYEQSMYYLAGYAFQKLTNEQFCVFLQSAAFQREITKMVKEMIKSTLNNPETKRYMYNRIKARFL